MLRFYADHNFHGAAIEGLRLRNIDIVTAMQDGHARAKDPLLLRRATELHRTILTQDTDLIDIAWNWIAEDTAFQGVIFAAQNSMPLGKIISDVLLIAELVGEDDIRNSIWRLPL